MFVPPINPPCPLLPPYLSLPGTLDVCFSYYHNSPSSLISPAFPLPSYHYLTNQRVLRAAVEGPGLIPVVGRDVVSDLIDIVEQPLLFFMPKIIKPRNDQILYRGQRAAVEVLFQLVLASDKAIQVRVGRIG